MNDEKENNEVSKETLYIENIPTPDERSVLSELKNSMDYPENLSRRMGVTLSAIHNHLSALERKKLIRKIPVEKFTYCEITPLGVIALSKIAPTVFVSAAFKGVNELFDEINKWILPNGWFYVGRKFLRKTREIIENVEDKFNNYDSDETITISTRDTSEGLKHKVSIRGRGFQGVSEYTSIELLKQNVFTIMRSSEPKQFRKVAPKSFFEDSCYYHIPCENELITATCDILRKKNKWLSAADIASEIVPQNISSRFRCIKINALKSDKLKKILKELILSNKVEVIETKGKRQIKNYRWIRSEQSITDKPAIGLNPVP